MKFVDIFAWLILWFGVMGLPNFLFKKFQIAYYKFPNKHILFYTLSILLLILVYKSYFENFFFGFSTQLLLFISLFYILWMLAPNLLKKDWFTRDERLRYQSVKFFEVLFQQLCILGGLLISKLDPISFGFVFFIIHTPVIFFIERKYGLIFTFSALIGGVIFATLQSIGVVGFMLSLGIHYLYYTVFHYILSIKNFVGVVHKR